MAKTKYTYRIGTIRLHRRILQQQLKSLEKSLKKDLTEEERIAKEKKIKKLKDDIEHFTRYIIWRGYK